MKVLMVVLTALSLGTAAAAQPSGPTPDDPIAAQLFPPEVVMQHQKRIHLTDAQRRSITGAISSLQARVLEIQWAMQDEQQKLVELLGPSQVDEAAAVAQAGRVMELERQVKQAHLGALIRIKNLLTREQQTQLRALQSRADGGK